VKHDYHGPIAYPGIGCQCLTSRSPTLPATWCTKQKPLGGQAVWDGNNFSGERARSGVYMVFASNEDGSQTCVTRLLFIN
jgi:hypothetical protein